MFYRHHAAYAMQHAFHLAPHRRRALTALVLAAALAPLLWWGGVAALTFGGDDDALETRRMSAHWLAPADEPEVEPRVTEMLLVYDDRPRPPAPMPPDTMDPPEPEMSQPEPVPVAAPEPEPELEPEPAPEPTPAPPQPRDRSMPSVAQAESNDLAPLDPRFLAEEDNVAEEETLARDTTLFDEAPTPELAGAEDDADDAGSEEDEPRDDAPESELAQAPDASMTEGSPETPPEVVAAAPAPSPEPRIEPPASPPVPEVEPQPATPEAPVTEGIGQEEPAPLPPLPRLAESFRPTGEPSETIAALTTPNAAAYQEVFGQRDARDREALAQQAAESSFAGDHEGRWERTRAALENFDVDVATGTETHLSTGSDAFAGYIHYLHNKIHPRWERYILWLDVNHGPASRLADASLYTELEYVIGRDGIVQSVHVVRGSGELVFDSEAINLLYDIGPHEPPPPAMVSSNGNAYIHWEFHRGPEMCGTFNTSVRMVGGDVPSDGG